ncbi:MAG TPA: potassium channel family protein [Steroidobacteraceae bacterium]|nr:potassium channel family protein [Steroidobacteraceae bacterium]
MTPELAGAVASPLHWAAVIVTVLLVGLAVGLHYEALQQLNRRMPHWRLARHPKILVMIFCILAVHIAEIWLFGIGLYWTVQVPGMGQITGADSFKLLDSVYVSATTYSTLGYGDLVPHGPVRFLLGTEALVGFVLITWSASFAYLEMGHYWGNRE